MFTSLLFVVACSTPEPAVAPPIEPAPAAAASTAPAPVPMRLATWNIAWLTERPGAVDGPEREEADYARLAAYAKALDADVIALQEVDGPEVAARVLGDGYTTYFAAGDRVQNVGIAVKNGLAGRGVEVVRHPDVVGLDVGGLRPGVDLSLVLGDSELRVLAVHLKAGCSFPDDPVDPPQGAACEKLAKQLPVLEAWIDARIDEGVGVAVMGDFNRQMDAPDVVWPALADGDPGPLWRVTDGRKSQCRPGSKALRYIDHVVLGPRATAWASKGSVRQHPFRESEAEVGDLLLSDHCPLSVDLALGTG